MDVISQIQNAGIIEGIVCNNRGEPSKRVNSLKKSENFTAQLLCIIDPFLNPNITDKSIISLQKNISSLYLKFQG